MEIYKIVGEDFLFLNIIYVNIKNKSFLKRSGVMKHIFIINPYAGTIDYSERIRKILKRKENFEYLVFDTEYKGHETVLTERMCNLFADEYIRFYACGGSGTFVNIVKGIRDFEKTEVAFFPCGLSYDFLKCFGCDQVHFHNINKLIEGEPLYVDLIDMGEHKAVNAFSTGVDSGVARDVDKFRMFSYIKSGIPYTISGIKNFILEHARNYKIEIDGKNYDGKYLLIYMGNGICYGNNYYPSTTANPCDGELEIILISPMTVFKLFKRIRYFAEGDTEEIQKFAKVIRGKQFVIQNDSKGKMYCTVDGEGFEQDRVEGKILQGRLRMIVPKGVMVRDVNQVKEALYVGRKR